MKKEKKRLVKIYMAGNNHPIRFRVAESTLNKYILDISENLQNQGHNNGFGWAHGHLLNNAMISHIKIYKR